MYEVELKFKITEFGEPIGWKLKEIGASCIDDEAACHMLIADTYYNIPGDAAGKAFRVRAITSTLPSSYGETAYYLTCKGKALETTSKTRREIEIKIDGDIKEITAFVELLGCTKVGVVEKTRQEWRVANDKWHFMICIDTIAIGQYLEIELIVKTEEECAPASDAILELASRLNLGEPERRSYFELLNGKRTQISGDCRA